MKGGTKIAAAVVGGYALGRLHKMRWALMIASAVAIKKMGSPAELLEKGNKFLAANPELGRLTENMRGRLSEAGKAATVGVLSDRISTFTDRIESSAPGRPQRAEPEEEQEPAAKKGEKPRKQLKDRDDEFVDEDEDYEEDDEEDTQKSERDEVDDEFIDEDEDEVSEEDEPTSGRRPRASETSAAATQSRRNGSTRTSREPARPQRRTATSGSGRRSRGGTS